MRTLLLASTSTIYGGKYLEYLLDAIEYLFKDQKDVLFIPFARPGGITFDAYTEIAAQPFKKLGKKLTGIVNLENSDTLIKNSEAIFVGGGNTFLLVNTLYKTNTLELIRQKVWNGTPYLGTSAGSNIAGLTMQTTNDMPIIYPPSFKTMGLIPFNINAHYLDSNPENKHMGETRETRIKEFHHINSQPVLGLREGSWLDVNDETIVLKGSLTARMFEQKMEPYEISPGKAIIVK